jgi:hypothetical protein
LCFCQKNRFQIAKSFREKKIPCDVIWMDIDYMDKFRCFTFHSVRIPVTLLQFELVGNMGVDHWRLYRCNMDLIDSLLALWIVFFFGLGCPE